MTRFLPVLVILSLIIFVACLSLIMEPDGVSVLIYLLLLAFLPFMLYQTAIKSIDPHFPPLLFLLAFIWRLISSALRYWTVVELYDGLGDALRYHEDGQYVAYFLQQFDFSILRDDAMPMMPGTAQMVYLTGLLYTFLPANLLGSFFFFAALAFVGSVFFYRAFRLAFDVEPSFFRLVIFFLPSILFWPSSLGKDAWIFFCSGLVAYGLVKYICRTQWSGLVVAGLGLLLVGLIRPHTAAFMVLALGVTYLLFFQRIRTAQDFIVWFVGGGLVMWLGLTILQSSQEFLLDSGLREVSWTGLKEFYEWRQSSTTAGGSRFISPVVLGLAGPIYAFVTVVLRPFPWEAHNPQAMATAVESLGWLWLFWSRREIFWLRIRSMRTNPWVAFALVYSIVVILSLTMMGNFGIIARQRVMFLPFLWMLLA